MNNIKFRAWDKVNKRIVQIDGIEFDGDELCQISYRGDCWRNAEEFELMQFTGLTDRNGDEIYKGDIVDIHGMYIVKFGEHGAPSVELEDYVETANGFYLKAEHDLKNVEPFGFDIPLNERYAKECVIIGNIYQNSELLKEQDDEY